MYCIVFTYSRGQSYSKLYKRLGISWGVKILQLKVDLNKEKSNKCFLGEPVFRNN